MATAKRGKRKVLPPTFLEREAAEALRGVMKRRRFTFKLLSRALEGLGEDLAPTTLSNRVSRGRFRFTFFIQCLYAMGMHDARISFSGMTEDELAEVQRVAKERSKRKPPVRPSAAVGGPSITQRGTTSSARSRSR